MNCVREVAGFLRLEVTSPARENWNMEHDMVTGYTDHCTSHTYTVNVEGDGGSTGETTQTEVDVGLGTGEDDEVGHPQGSRHMDKVH